MSCELSVKNLSSTSVKLNEKNYPLWCQAFETFIDTHRKVRHLKHDPPDVKDTVYEVVLAQRYECLRCGRTFRVYPCGVSRAQTSKRLKGLAVMLYLLGLSYGAVSLVLEALGVRQDHKLLVTKNVA